MTAKIRFPFDERKAAQAAAHLLERHGGTVNYMKLIKLLYLADREAILSRGAPITGDEMFSLPHGPILSRTLTLIKGEVEGAVWGEYVKPRQGYTVSTTDKDDRSALSQREVDILDAIDRKYGGMTEWELRRFTHEALPEYEDPGTSCIPIEIETIVKVAGHDRGLTIARVRERAQEALSADPRDRSASR